MFMVFFSLNHVGHGSSFGNVNIITSMSDQDTTYPYNVNTISKQTSSEGEDKCELGV